MTPLRQHNHHNHGRRRRKWSPRASQNALRPAPTRHIDRGQSPEQADMLVVGIDRAYAPQNARMLWRCIAAGTKERLRGIRPINHPLSTFLARGIVLDQSDASARGLALDWDSRCPFPPAAIMVGLVVVCCCHPRTGVDRNPGVLHIVGIVL